MEAEFEPGSKGRVLRNLLGIRSVRKMAVAESEALLATTEDLVRTTRGDQRFTSADLRAMHRAWLGEIYPWAGEYRQVNLSKGDLTFAAARFIERLMVDLERGLMAELTPCREGESGLQARALGTLHAELILIHPFREGNGRCARLLAMLMGLQAGLPPLSFRAFEGSGKHKYFRAIQAAMDRNYEPITERFISAISGTLRSQKRASRAS